ncbi:hypothetical protein ACVIQY_001058 [Bradyrhizobium sp. USDA 3051]
MIEEDGSHVRHLPFITRAHEPDIDRAAEGLSRAAPAAGAGAADARVRACARARPGHGRGNPRARSAAQDCPQDGSRRGPTAAYGRSVAAAVPGAGTIPRRSRRSDPGRAGPPLLAGSDLAMARPRRCSGQAEGTRGGAGAHAGRQRRPGRSADLEAPGGRCGCHLRADGGRAGATSRVRSHALARPT